MTDADILRLAANWQAYRDSKEPTLRGADAILAFGRAIASAALADLAGSPGAMLTVVRLEATDHEGATCD